jgi:biopolymer transport protein ExbD
MIETAEKRTRIGKYFTFHLVARRFAMLGLLCLAFGGCVDNERKPVPMMNIRILADGTYTLNREVVSRKKLAEEIERVADENRRDITHTSRVLVRIGTQAGASQTEKSKLVNEILAAGINSIEQSFADE